MRKFVVVLVLAVALVSAVLIGHAASAKGVSLHYARGYSVQGSWLCYGWSGRNHVYHCTQHWHLNNLAVPWSDNPSWVPNIGN